MGDILLGSADYDLVRGAIDTSLTSAALSDDTIRLGVYLGAAEREAKSRVADWATRVGDELAALKSATANLVAARIAPAVPQIVQAKDDGLSRSLAERDMVALAAYLRGLADTELQTLVSGSVRPTMFAAAAGSRGQ